MSKFGFSKIFVRWVKDCINSPWIALLVNGRPTKFFQATKGIQQGFPMSPFLYLLVVESMSGKRHHLKEFNNLKGLKISRGFKDVSDVQFANDNILLGGAYSIITEKFNCALSTFLKASDDKVNSCKSKVYGWKFPSRTFERIARNLRFEGNVTWNYFNYLRIPIFKGKKGLLTGKGWSTR